MAKKAIKKVTKLQKVNKFNKFKKLTKSKKVENKMPIQPLGDRVLIKELAETQMERTTAAGIIIPDSAEKDSGGKKGRVVAVGNGKIEDGKRLPLSISVGDTVLYQWGDKITINGNEYVIVRESEIIAVLN